ncbi:MAG: aldolase catalytic domain-containing protein [Oscillospiraceae bacterium]|jgi:4-hydroxy 2-oxovalerate aldolase|nr:aldolase catalytic domain-containing protein [Oscillospiraceae bacterium]
MKIQILDCTLRDGGYVNDWNFGEKSIKHITEKLSESNIDIIECGFLRTDKNNVNCSLYGDIKNIYIPENEHNKRMFVAMIEFGGIDIKKIPQRQNSFISGIRLTFHNNEWEQTKQNALELMEKGYKVFIQPVGITSYSDIELLKLIEDVNKLSPFAFYLVDTLGSLFKNDLLRLSYMVHGALSPEISLGFHSHNNLQLSFSNAMNLIETGINRTIILDSTIYGMGRGAGNLPTELIVHYINKNIERKYDIIKILELIDEVILPIQRQNNWGYLMPYTLASLNNAHPNYATFLIEKEQITIPQMEEILRELPKEKRHLYDKAKIKEIYYSAMNNKVDDTETISTLKELISDNVLVISPGKNIIKYAELINDYIKKHNPLIISVNFIPKNISPNFVFFGNNKRLLQNYNPNYSTIVSSNVENKEGCYVVDYNSLISADHKDNSGMMILRLLLRLEIKQVALAGYDGFKKAESFMSNETIQKLNSDMQTQLDEISKNMLIEFITPTSYMR